MAAGQAPKTRTAESNEGQQEGFAGPANAAEPDALSDPFQGNQRGGMSCAVASMRRPSRTLRKVAFLRSIQRIERRPQRAPPDSLSILSLNRSAPG